MNEIPELLERFRRGPELVATAMTGAAGAELDFAPDAGKWSIRQIVCHLSDSEIVGADRLRRIIAEPGSILQAYNEKAWAANLNYSKRRTSEALETFRRIRAESHDLLKDLPDEAYTRTATHTERGAVSLLDMLRIMAEHAEGHARQMREAREAYKNARNQRNARGTSA